MSIVLLPVYLIYIDGNPEKQFKTLDSRLRGNDRWEKAGMTER